MWLQEGSIFSGLSPASQAQVWDRTGLVESVREHHLGEALSPRSTQSGCFIAWETLDCGADGPTPQLQTEACRGPVCGSLGNVYWRTVTQDLCLSVTRRLQA